MQRIIYQSNAPEVQIEGGQFTHALVLSQIVVDGDACQSIVAVQE
jgi:hypothetical protein